MSDILDAASIGVRSAYGGAGACGPCLVHIEEEAVDEPNAGELINLSADQLQRRIRLACQVRPTGDLRITIENPSPESHWTNLPADEFAPALRFTPSVPVSTAGAASYGVAVDLGTMRIRLSLWDMHKGRRIAGRSGLNPQVRFGADVLTRLMTASDTAERSREIGLSARNAIGEALQDISSVEFRNIQQVGDLVIVGNTAMLALLTGKNSDVLLQPDYWTREVAYLVKAGIVDSRGKFADNIEKEGFVILEGRKNIVLKEQDVDVLQRAKAAIGAGTSYLLKKTGLRLRDLKRICVGGAFGRFLNVTNASG